MEAGFDSEKSQFFGETRRLLKSVLEVRSKKATQCHRKIGLCSSKIGLQTCSESDFRWGRAGTGEDAIQDKVLLKCSTCSVG